MQAPKSKLTKSINQLAASLDATNGDSDETAEQPEKQKSKSLFSFLTGAGK